MAEKLSINKEAGKNEQYSLLLTQLEALTADEPDLYANLANVAAGLKEAFDFFWVGFYLVKKNQLVLGPFQGPIACTRIDFGKGVCGTSWKDEQTIIVDNVELFPGHIACSSESKSEIVVPLVVNDKVRLVLDVDGDSLNAFDTIDQAGLEEVVALFGRHFQ
jgi:GAF domain-containing protein